MDTHEELRELDIAEIDAVGGGRLPEVVGVSSRYV
jgi:hypothetical protein